MARFNPIPSKEELLEAVRYVATEVSKLTDNVVGLPYPIKSLTVFSHSESEYALLIGILSGMGKPHDENNGPRVELTEPIEVGENHITHLRIRKPDPERPQVGCADLTVEYTSFKKTFLEAYPHNIRLIKRPNYDMLELHHPEFDVLAYVVSK
jgi:hypothetical protein